MIETGSCFVAQADFKFGDLPVSVPLSARIIGVHHCAWLQFLILTLKQNKKINT
jgi:hypothetical protein